ncbi:MAG: hypothetical protein KF847_08250 [Pirellulales bacterium]|nr:hypothetical protein [Pirellulales bacterium]
MIEVKRQVHFRQRRHARKASRNGEAKPEDEVGRVPRISRLMALAIRFDQLIRDGAVIDQAELARLGHVSRARLTQIMNLLNLAPEIQEALLFLPPEMQGRGGAAERSLRPLTALSDWSTQKRQWHNSMGTPLPHGPS